MKTTTIELFEGSDRHPAGERMGPEWEAGVWTWNDRQTFGLVLRGEPTHMAYFVDDYFKPCQVIAKLDQPGRERFYFDAGGNGHPIWAERDALAEAMDRVGLIPHGWDEVRPDHGTGHWPEHMTLAELAGFLGGVVDAVSQGDSFEGFVEYLIPDDLDKVSQGMVAVRARVRVGNSMGQGSMCVIGNFEPPKETPA